MALKRSGRARRQKREASSLWCMFLAKGQHPVASATGTPNSSGRGGEGQARKDPRWGLSRSARLQQVHARTRFAYGSRTAGPEPMAHQSTHHGDDDLALSEESTVECEDEETGTARRDIVLCSNILIIVIRPH